MYPMYNDDDTPQQDDGSSLLAQSLRRKNLFNNTPSGPAVNPSMLDSGKPDINAQPQKKSFADTYKELASLPTGEAQQKLKDFLESGPPNKEDYKPGKMTRLAAALSGAGASLQGRIGEGFRIQDEITSEPYNRAMSSYKMQGDKLSKAADLEEKDINNRVKTYRDFTQDQEHSDNLQRQNRLTDAQIADYQSKDEERKAKATKWASYKGDDGYQWYTRINPDTGEPETKRSDDKIFQSGKEAQSNKIALAKTQADSRASLEKLRQAGATKFMITKGGDIVALYKDGRAEDTGISSGTLSDEDKANLTNTNKKDYEAGREKNRLEVQAAKDKAAMERKTTVVSKPDTTTTTEMKDKAGNVIATKIVTTSTGKKVDGVMMSHPQVNGGKPGLIPKERVQEAIKAGYVVAK